MGTRSFRPVLQRELSTRRSDSRPFEPFRHFAFFYRRRGFCLSEEGDLLSQWRAYADNGAGISIGFDNEYFENIGNLRRDREEPLSAHLQKVEYDEAIQRELIKEPLEKILSLVKDGALKAPTLLSTTENTELWQAKRQSLGMQFFFFFPLLFRLKNPAFAEEREWRVISWIFSKLSAKNFKGQLADISIRAAEDRIAPYGRISLEEIDRESIKEIIIGPRNVTPERVIWSALEKYGWSKVIVRKSSASYR